MKIVSCRHIHVNISEATVLKRTAYTAYNLMIGCSEKDYVTMLLKCCQNVATRRNFTKKSFFVASYIFFVAGNKQQNQIDLILLLVAGNKKMLLTTKKNSGDTNEIFRRWQHFTNLLPSPENVAPCPRGFTDML